MSYESWRISYQSSEQAARAAFDEIATLRAQLAAAEAGAERYRWLRENGDQAIGRDRGCGPEWTYGEELDALIDAALRGEVKP